MASTQLLNKLIIDRRRGLPLHIQIQRALRELIDLHFADGDAFFTEAELVESLGISRPTVRQALSELNREGLLLRRPAIGTIITKTPSAHIPASASPASTKLRKNMAEKQTACMGIFLPEYDSEFLAMLLQKIMEESRLRNLPVQTYYTHRGDDLKWAYKQISRSPNEERFLLLDSSLELSQALWDAGYRTVAVEAQAENYAGASVETDAAMAVQIGIDYLRALSHKRITLLINEPVERSSVQQKVSQFQQALPEGRIVVCGTQEWENSFEAAYAHMSEVWGSEPGLRPTALMTTSDPGAWAALRWFAEHGVSVPHDVSVLGFEDARSSRFMHPSLSTLAHPIEALVQAALTMLWEVHWNPSRQRLAPHLVIRDSTGAAPTSEQPSG
jgi:DNA-binding LacI/PurR family transcriptional regulator